MKNKQNSNLLLLSTSFEKIILIQKFNKLGFALEIILM